MYKEITEMQILITFFPAAIALKQVLASFFLLGLFLKT